MNRILLLGGLLLSLASGCESPSTRQPAPAAPTPHSSTKPTVPVRLPDGAVRGDFDGDGTAEYVWLVPPQLDSTDANCVGACTSYLTSSNPALRPYALETAIDGTLTVYPHLGAGRRDYVGIAPAWFMGCWSRYFVLTYRPGGWQLGVEPFSTHCDQWEKDSVAVSRDGAHPGHVLIHYTDMAAEDFAVKTKSVPLR